jgi:hypothetical protein
MQSTIQPQQNMKTKTQTLSARDSINPLRWRCGFFLIPVALICLAISPTAQAQLPSPTPDGGYPNDNTAEGDGALHAITTGNHNAAVGTNALSNDTTGGSNVAVGAFTLENNNGDKNIAVGNAALNNNTTGTENIAIGFEALVANTTNSWNIAVGNDALHENVGAGNVAVGWESMTTNRSGTSNTALGFQALRNNDSGNDNVAIGVGALSQNNTGSNNIALGPAAGGNLTTGNNNIDIGNQGVASEGNTIRIGDPANQTATFIAGINGVDKSGGNPVFTDANGQLGTGRITAGSVVMLPAVNGVAPTAPAGYTFKGFMLLSPKANGGGPATSYAVYTKS